MSEKPPVKMKYTIPTLLALYQETEILCSWTEHAKECQILRSDRDQRQENRQTDIKRPLRKISPSRWTAGQQRGQPWTPKPKPRDRIKTNKRKTIPSRLPTDKEGFTRFLREHSSPKHYRVTAGGQIVPFLGDNSPNQKDKDPKEPSPSLLGQGQCPLACQNCPANLTTASDPNIIENTIHGTGQFSGETLQQGDARRVPFTVAQTPTTVGLSSQPFPSPVCFPPPIEFHPMANMSSQVDGSRSSPFNMNAAFITNPTELLELRLNRMHYVVRNVKDGGEDFSLTEFRNCLQELVDLVGEPSTDNDIEVQWLMYLHGNVKTALAEAENQVRLIDAEIARHSSTTPSQVQSRIRCKQVRALVYDTFDEVQQTLNETLDRFEGDEDVCQAIVATLCPDPEHMEQLTLSAEPDASNESVSASGQVHDPPGASNEPVSAPGQAHGPATDEVQRYHDMCRNAFATQTNLDSIFDPRNWPPEFSRPVPRSPSPPPGAYNDLYDDSFSDNSEGQAARQKVQDNIDRSFREDAAREQAAKEQAAEVHSEEPPAGGDACQIVEPTETSGEESDDEYCISDQEDDPADIRTPRFLPQNLERRDSQTLPRNFPRSFSFSSASPLAAERRTTSSSQLFPSGRQTGTHSDSSMEHEDWVEKKETSIADGRDLESKAVTLPDQPSTSEDGVTNEAVPLLESNTESKPTKLDRDASNRGMRDDSYDADTDEVLPKGQTEMAAGVARNTRQRLNRNNLRAMQGIGCERATSHPTVQTSSATAFGLPGRYKNGPGWMAKPFDRLSE